MLSDFQVVQRVVSAVFPGTLVGHDKDEEYETFVVGQLMITRYAQDGEWPDQWMLQKAVYDYGSRDDPPDVDIVDGETVGGISQAVETLVREIAKERAWHELENIGIDEKLVDDAELAVSPIPCLDESGCDIV